MPTKYRVYPYKMGSVSSRSLSNSLGGWQIYPDRRFYPKSRHCIINWGNTLKPNWWNENLKILNTFEAVENAKNKLNTFNILELNGISHVDFTTDRSTVSNWLNEGKKVYCRRTVTGCAGEGIVIARQEEEVVNSPMYTKGIDTKAEYRVHVFNGEVIDYIKKRRVLENEPTEIENQIRNHANGWIFTRNNLNRLERVEELAVKAVKALGLDFGAVDIIKDTDNVCYVLEVNTACGLEGQTLENYRQAIIKHFNN